MRGLYAELLKLRRPALLWISLIMIVLAILFGAMSQQPNFEYIRNQQAADAFVRADPPAPGDFGLSSEGPAYEQALAENLRGMERQTREAVRDGALVGATQHPVGALGLASGLAVSTVGALLLFLVAGAHVGGEWNDRTIKEILARDGRRYRFVLSKIASVWLAGVWLLLCSWVGLVCLGFVSQRIWPISEPASTTVAWAWAGPQLGRALLVLLLLAVVGACLSVVVRNPFGAFFGGIILLVALGFASRFSALERFVPIVWVGTWMRFDTATAPESYLIDHPVSASESIAVGATASGVGIAALCLLLTAVAIVSMTRRRDILI
jgi:hypothetical protein